MQDYFIRAKIKTRTLEQFDFFYTMVLNQKVTIAEGLLPLLVSIKKQTAIERRLYKMLAIERRNLILENLQDDKRVLVGELSQRFNVSEETIRRDLEKICKDGLAIKSYGGAILNENESIEMPFNVRKKRNVSGKQKIAKIVEALIDNGDHIILDASTTAVFIAKALKHKERLTVITNSIEIIIELSDMAGWNIISTGGSLKEGYLNLVGPKTIENLKDYNVDKVILSCKGIHTEKGITDANELFSQTKRAMLDSAKSYILAVESSKFGMSAFSKITDISNMDTIITDIKPSQKWLDLFTEKGIVCLYPENPPEPR